MLPESASAKEYLDVFGKQVELSPEWEEEMVDDLSKNFGIHVHVEDEAETFMNDFSDHFEIKTADDELRRKRLFIFLHTLAFYPREFIQHCAPLDLVITGDIKVKKSDSKESCLKQAAGFMSGGASNAYDKKPIPVFLHVDEAVDKRSAFFSMTGTDHHELFHIADVRDGGWENDSKLWHSFNPTGFAYLNDKYCDEAALHGNIVSVSNYGHRNEREDKAEVAEQMMLYPRENQLKVNLELGQRSAQEAFDDPDFHAERRTFLSKIYIPEGLPEKSRHIKGLYEKWSAGNMNASWWKSRAALQKQDLARSMQSGYKGGLLSSFYKRQQTSALSRRAFFQIFS